jgi:hypothetical protein
VGAPWLTRNEARARQNLPHIDGADELIVPLNVIEGGQSSPAAPLNNPGGGAAALGYPDAYPGPLPVPAAVQAVAARALGRAAADAPLGPRLVAAHLASGEADAELVERLAVWFATKGDQKHPEWELRGGNEARAWVEQVMAPAVKAAVPGDTPAETEAALVARLVAYLTSQERKVLAGLGAGGNLPGVFDREAQDARLTRVLVPAGWTFALLGAAGVLATDEQRAFRAAPMAKWLTPTAARAAFGINETTYQQLAGVVTGATWRDDVAHVYEVARDARAPQQAQSWNTTTSSFGAQEAAKATGRATKTWRTTSARPRASHARLDGVTVGVHERFPNGARYPGDPALSEDERAGCHCVVEYGHPAPPPPAS